jgi:hypothetical protein
MNNMQVKSNFSLPHSNATEELEYRTPIESPETDINPFPNTALSESQAAQELVLLGTKRRTKRFVLIYFNAVDQEKRAEKM